MLRSTQDRHPRRISFILVALSALALLGLVAPGQTATETATSPPETPGSPDDARLVVFVVVDQLRGDLLDRYDTVFTGGFARLRAQGSTFRNATFDHAQTSTAPGHRTAVSGLHPHRHGLVGNRWLEETAGGEWEEVYALRDLQSPVAGEPGMEGRGPANIDGEAFPEWLLSAHPEARVVSLSGKDRAAIAMAGWAHGEVYWLDSARGRFLTGEYYRSDYPDWLESFHAQILPRVWSDTVWHSEVPDWAASLSRPDTLPYEGDGVHTYFPHRAVQEAGSHSERDLNRWRGRGPYPDKAVLELARTAVQELALGSRAAPDYLALGLSQVDRVGHDYGPLSREQLDNLIRLDRGLGEFMDLLDREVGEGAWLMAFTGDHGVIELPEARRDLGLYGRRISPHELADLISRAEEAADAAGSESGADALERARAAADAALELDWVEDAFAWEDLLAGTPTDSLQALFPRSYHPDRALAPLGHLGVGLRTVEGAYSGRYPQGTGHGSPFYYDRHVPFILLGPGIPAEHRDDRVSVVDLAPTVAELLGIPYPEGLDGQPILKRLEEG